MNTKRLLLPLATSIATLLAAQAEAQILWSSTPSTNIWNSAGNWVGGNVPDTNLEQAVFEASSITGISLTAATTIQKLTFNATAPAYTISGSALTIDTNTTTAAADAILVTAGAGAVVMNNALTLNDSNATGGNI